MNDKLPIDRQIVEVCVGKQWQPAMFRDGEFVDSYGLPIDRRKITSWRTPRANAENRE